MAAMAVLLAAFLAGRGFDRQLVWFRPDCRGWFFRRFWFLRLAVAPLLPFGHFMAPFD